MFLVCFYLLHVPGNFCQTSEIILLSPKPKKVPSDHKSIPLSRKQNKTSCFDFPQGGLDFCISRIWLEKGKYKHTTKEQNTEGTQSVSQPESEALTPRALTWNVPPHWLLIRQALGV